MTISERRLAGIEESHFLRRSDNDGSADLSQQIDRRHGFIAGSGRQIHQKKIQILPFHATEQLIDEFIFIGVAPNNGIVRILEQEGHRRDLEIVGLVRNDAPRGADLELLPLRPHHLRNIGSMDVHVADSDMPAFQGKAHGQIGGAGAFPHAALVAHDEHLVLDPLHPLGNQPPAMAFLVFLTGLILVADRAGPHVGTVVALSGTGMRNDVEFARHLGTPIADHRGWRQHVR